MNAGQNSKPEPLALTLAKLSDDYAQELLRFFARSPISLMQEIIQTKRANFNRHGRNWLKEYPHKDLDVELACLMMACREMYMASRSLKYKDRRGRDKILEADRLMAELRQEQASFSIKKPRRKPKLEAINVRLPMILELRGKGYSWRELSTYLSRHAGLKVTHVYLRESVMMLAGNDWVTEHKLEVPTNDQGNEG